MKRRLNLAVALVHQPKIVILDESTVGMDLEARLKMWEAIRNLRNDGTTVLLTTHLMDEAEALSDRIGILHDGRLAALGAAPGGESAPPGSRRGLAAVVDRRPGLRGRLSKWRRSNVLIHID